MTLGVYERKCVFRAGRKFTGVLQVGELDDVVSHCRASEFLAGDRVYDLLDFRSRQRRITIGGVPGLQQT